MVALGIFDGENQVALAVVGLKAAHPVHVELAAAILFGGAIGCL